MGKSSIVRELQLRPYRIAIVYTQILCFIRHLETISCVLIYADSIFLTSQSGLKTIARNANILPAYLIRCTVPFMGVKAIAKRILKRS